MYVHPFILGVLVALSIGFFMLVGLVAICGSNSNNNNKNGKE